MGCQTRAEWPLLLVQMSHQLKLNALHFSSTLNEEKKLLESSSTALDGETVYRPLAYLPLQRIPGLYSQSDKDKDVQDQALGRVLQDARDDLARDDFDLGRHRRMGVDVSAHPHDIKAGESSDKATLRDGWA